MAERANYDSLAEGYDQHYLRPVDQWEDERMIELLSPYVDGRDVLDLGCGTGWLLDHLLPRNYTGIDASAAMLNRLLDKHPGARVFKADIGEPGWLAGQPFEEHRYDTVVSTWAAEYFPHLGLLLNHLTRVVKPGGHIALHGNQPRGTRRKSRIDAFRGYDFSRQHVEVLGHMAGLRPGLTGGTGALPDRLARWRWLWRAALWWPDAGHYACLHVWSR